MDLSNLTLPMAWRCRCGYFSDEMDRTVCKGCHGSVNDTRVTKFLLIAVSTPTGEDDPEEY